MDRDILKNLKEYLEKTDFPEEIKAQIMLGATMGVKPETIIRTATETLSAIETEKAEESTPRQEIQGDYNETELTIIAMLTENTGAHILDSGGAYGRNWQRNRQIKDWNKLPVLEVTVWKDGEVDFSLNIYHYLRKFLEVTPTSKMLTKWLYRYGEKPELRNKSWLACIESWTEMLRDFFGYTIEPTFNSYNWENILSQVIQGCVIHAPTRYSFETETYLILQIHGGCDVRGGYTDPVVFYLEEDLIGQFYHTMNAILAYCGCTQLSSDDGGFHWYGEKETKDYSLPKYWISKPSKENAKNWEYHLVCEKCHKKVKFASDLEMI